MSEVPALLPFEPAKPVNDLFSTVAMARDLLMACDNGRCPITIEGAVAKNVLETLIGLAEAGARAANPEINRRELAFSNLVQTATTQGEREEAVGGAWFMQDTAAGIR